MHTARLTLVGRVLFGGICLEGVCPGGCLPGGVCLEGGCLQTSFAGGNELAVAIQSQWISAENISNFGNDLRNLIIFTPTQ